MPITKSVKKSLRASENKRMMNKKQEIELEKALRKVSKENINEVISKIDKAAKTHLIHKNKAARLKSRLMKKFATVKNVKTKSVNVSAKGGSADGQKATAKNEKEKSSKKQNN